MGGTKTEMERLLKDAQKLTGVKYDISNLNDVFQAIHVIQTELGITGTTAKEAEETISGSFSSMKAALDNFLNGTGTFDQLVESAKIAFKNIYDAASEQLPRIAKEIIDSIPDEVFDNINKLKNDIIEAIPYVEALGIAILSWKVGSTLQGLITGVQKAKVAISLLSLELNGANIAQSVLNGTLTFGETIVALFTGKVTLAQLAAAGLAKAQAVLNAVLSANPIMLVVLAIGALIAILVVFWNKSEGFRNFWTSLWEGIKNVFSIAKDFIIEKIQEIINFFVNLPAKLGELKNNATNKVSELVDSIVNKFTDLKNKVIQKIQEFGNSILEI